MSIFNVFRMENVTLNLLVSLNVRPVWAEIKIKSHSLNQIYLVNTHIQNQISSVPLNVIMFHSILMFFFLSGDVSFC